MKDQDWGKDKKAGLALASRCSCTSAGSQRIWDACVQFQLCHFTGEAVGALKLSQRDKWLMTRPPGSQHGAPAPQAACWPPTLEGAPCWGALCALLCLLPACGGKDSRGRGWVFRSSFLPAYQPPALGSTSPSPSAFGPRPEGRSWALQGKAGADALAQLRAGGGTALAARA